MSFDDMLTDIFADEIMAQDATYTAPGGQPVPVRVIEDIADRESQYHPTSIQSEGGSFDIQVSSLADAPAVGGTLVVNGITYVINGTPRKIDPSGLIWNVTAPPQ